MDYIYLIPAAGIIALIFVFIKNLSVSKKEVGNAKMAEIAKNKTYEAGLSVVMRKK